MPESLRRAPVEPREIDGPVGISMDRTRGELAKGEVIEELLP